jgi:hypothetical protein
VNASASKPASEDASTDTIVRWLRAYKASNRSTAGMWLKAVHDMIADQIEAGAHLTTNRPRTDVSPVPDDLEERETVVRFLRSIAAAIQRGDHRALVSGSKSASNPTSDSASDVASTDEDGSTS